MTRKKDNGRDKPLCLSVGQSRKRNSSRRIVVPPWYFLRTNLRVWVVDVEELVSQLIDHVHFAGVDVHLRLKAGESEGDKNGIAEFAMFQLGIISK